jgi:phenylacetate-coenzyme A ligase PaaK-like adenylate-forming protein
MMFATTVRTASDRLRERLLQETLQHAITRSPYYREALRGLDPDQLTLERLSSLPLLSKRDLNEHFEALQVFDRYPDHLMYTSGTTGRPLEVPVYQEEIDAYEALVLDHWLGHYGDAQPLVLTIIRIGHGTQIMTGRIPTLPCHIQFGLGQFLDMMRSQHRVNGRVMRPTVVDTNVLCLRQITRGLLADGIDPATLGAEVLVVSGWYMPDWERAFFAQTWNATLVERYGVTEVHGDAKRYPGADYYTFDFTVIPEVIDPDTRQPIEEGVGLMVMTGLYPFNQAVPKIRYLIGDLVEVTRTDYLGGELGIRFLAREGDAITAPRGAGEKYRFFSSDVAEALGSLPDVARKSNTGFLKFVLSEPVPHTGRIEVELTYPPALFPSRVRELTGHILDVIGRRARHGGSANVEVIFHKPGTIGQITKL